MGFESKIQWTTHTFNPWWGCTRVSQGCTNCYAEALAKRYGHDIWGTQAPRRTLSPAYWRQPARWNAEAKKNGVRAQVFCASMADVFEAEAPQEERQKLWQVIRETPWLDWQLLTKRPQNIEELLPFDWGDGWKNVWLGATVEDVRVVERSQVLARIPACVRFLSVEPLIGRIECLPLEGIGWAIIGGESGPGARAMNPEWALEVMEQCQAANVAVFFKQLGSALARQQGIKGKGGEWADLPHNLQIRQMPVPPNLSVAQPPLRRRLTSNAQVLV